MVTAQEKDIEDYLYDLSRSNRYLECDDLCLEGKCFRQVNLDGYGVADLVFIGLDVLSNTLHFDIVELKKEKLNLAAVGQTVRYKRGMDRFLKVFIARIPMFRRTDYVITCHLIGKKYSDDDACFVADELNNFYVYFYEINLTDGIKFTEMDGWYKTRENFRSISKILRKEQPKFKKSLAGYYKYLLEGTCK